MPQLCGSTVSSASCSLLQLFSAKKKKRVASAAERYNYLVSSQSVNRLVELATGASAVAVAATAAASAAVAQQSPLSPLRSHKSIDHVL